MIQDTASLPVSENMLQLWLVVSWIGLSKLKLQISQLVQQEPRWLSFKTRHNLTSESGCRVKCTIIEYHFKRTKEESVTWKQEWSSAFYLHAETTEERLEEEYWVFDTSDALNGIGGALGLFLGWSILFILQKILAMCQKIYEQCA